MIIRPAAERPVEFPFVLADRQVVDARMPKGHQPVVVELPVLVAVRTEPVSGVVVPLIGEADGDAVAREGPQFLDQPVIKLARPLAGQECNDLLVGRSKFGSVPPAALFAVCQRTLAPGLEYSSRLRPPVPSGWPIIWRLIDPPGKSRGDPVSMA